VSRTSRARGYEPRPQDATPRSAYRIVSRRRPSMSEDANRILQTRYVVNIYLRIVAGKEDRMVEPDDDEARERDGIGNDVAAGRARIDLGNR